MVKLNKSLITLLVCLKRFSPNTYEHSVKVALIASEFGRFLNLNDKELDILKTASLLHDIGKLMIPSKILHKPGVLTDEEYEIIKNHSKIGYDLILKTGFNDKEVLKLVLCHHERLDGKGYPNHVDNKQIDSLNKILTICDCYDAMKSRRKYKESKDINYIKSELINNIGTQFDEAYTLLFLEYIDSLNNKRVYEKKEYSK